MDGTDDLREPARGYAAGKPGAKLAGGYLSRFNLTGNRRAIAVDDARLEDRRPTTWTSTTSPRARACSSAANLGVVTDVRTGPNGNLFVVSLSNGAVYEIFRQGPSSRQAE